MKYVYGVRCKSCDCVIQGETSDDKPVQVECPDCLSLHSVKPYLPVDPPKSNGLRLCRCGSKPSMTAPVEPKAYQIVCGECGRMGEPCDTTIGAVEEWNAGPGQGCGELASFKTVAPEETI
jgi:hypothetical protein